MAKPASLNDALNAVTPQPATPQAVASERKKVVPIQSREGTALVGAHLPAKYQKAIKILSAETGQSQRELFEEALKMLFVAKGVKI